jgi:hypothetical protein
VEKKKGDKPERPSLGELLALFFGPVYCLQDLVAALYRGLYEFFAAA